MTTLGRPPAHDVVAFEGVMESLCAIDEDERALDHAHAALKSIHDLETRIVDEIRRRIARIETGVKPELRLVLKTLDRRLTSATLVRRVAQRAMQCAAESRE